MLSEVWGRREIPYPLARSIIVVCEGMKNQQDVIKRITDMQRLLHDAQQEIAALPETLQAGAQRIVNHARERYEQLTTDWEATRTRMTITLTVCDSFCRQLDDAMSPPHKLILRRIHYHNLQQLEQQRAALPPTLPADALKMLLEAQVASTQQHIANLEQKHSRDAHETGLLAIHQRNLTILQDMLVGARPYGTLGFWNSLLDNQQAIARIEAEFARA